MLGKKLLEICPRGNNKDYLLSYFLFMINVYPPCYNCINRKQNICVEYKEQSVPSKPLMTSSLVNSWLRFSSQELVKVT